MTFERAMVILFTKAAQTVIAERYLLIHLVFL